MGVRPPIVIVEFVRQPTGQREEQLGTHGRLEYGAEGSISGDVPPGNARIGLPARQDRVRRKIDWQQASRLKIGTLWLRLEPGAGSSALCRVPQLKIADS